MVFRRTRNLPLGLAAKISKEGHAVALLTVESTPDQRIAVLSREGEGVDHNKLDG